MYVTVTETWQMQTEDMTTKQQIMPNVTTNSMAGIVSEELQGQKWWQNVQIIRHVVQTSLPGWVRIILQSLKVESWRQFAFESLPGVAIVATQQSTLTWRTAAPSMSTSCFPWGIVTFVIAALTNLVKNDLSVKPDIDGPFVTWLPHVCFRWSSFYHLKTATTKETPYKQANGEKKMNI